jgi:hypothetical protein
VPAQAAQVERLGRAGGILDDGRDQAIRHKRQNTNRRVARPSPDADGSGPHVMQQLPEAEIGARGGKSRQPGVRGQGEAGSISHLPIGDATQSQVVVQVVKAGIAHLRLRGREAPRFAIPAEVRAIGIGRAIIMIREPADVGPQVGIILDRSDVIPIGLGGHRFGVLDQRWQALRGEPRSDSLDIVRQD